MDRKTSRLLRLVALPLAMGSTSLVALLLVGIAQALAGEPAGLGAFGTAGSIGALVGTAVAVMRLMNEDPVL